MDAITDTMLNDFNKIMFDRKSIVRLKRFPGRHNPAIEIVLVDEVFIESFIINMTVEFYEMLIEYFAIYDMQISFNNTMSTFFLKGQLN